LLALYRAVREAVNRGRARLKRGIAEQPHQTTFVSSGLLSPVGSVESSSQTADVSKGKKVHSVSSPQKALFESSDDWAIQFDIDVPEDAQMKGQPFPAHIAAVAKRPDGLIYSEKLKKLVYIELTAVGREHEEVALRKVREIP